MRPLISCLFTLLTPVALGQYVLQDDYLTGSFADKFNFFTGNDPTNGYVNYLSQTDAATRGLLSTSPDGSIYMGVDNTNVATGRGRDSVRIESKKVYNHGLFILDLAHMPGGQCGTWPAYWFIGPGLQEFGELDIIEGINLDTTSLMSLKTNQACSISQQVMTGTLETTDCNINTGGIVGCSIDSTSPATYGTGFNSIGGGVYATEWTSAGITVWVFPRNAIPSDITAGNPQPSSLWGTPVAKFVTDCVLDEHFVNQNIIMNIDFCGDYAGNPFWYNQNPSCTSQAASCNDFVRDFPGAFVETYWRINALKVYQISAATTTSSSTSTATTTSTLTTTSQLTTTTTTSELTSSLSSTTSQELVPTSTTSATSSTSTSAAVESTTTTSAFTTNSDVTSTTSAFTTTPDITSTTSSSSLSVLPNPPETTSSSSSSSDSGPTGGSTTTSSTSSLPSSSPFSSSSSTSSSSSSFVIGPTLGTTTSTTSIEYTSSSASSSWSSSLLSSSSLIGPIGGSTTSSSTSSSEFVAFPSSTTTSQSTSSTSASVIGPIGGSTTSSTTSRITSRKPTSTTLAPNGGWGAHGVSSTVITTTLKGTWIEPCSTGLTTKTTSFVTTHCGCTEEPLPSFTLTTTTITCPADWPIKTPFVVVKPVPPQPTKYETIVTTDRQGKTITITGPVVVPTKTVVVPVTVIPVAPAGPNVHGGPGSPGGSIATKTGEPSIIGSGGNAGAGGPPSAPTGAPNVYPIAPGAGGPGVGSGNVGVSGNQASGGASGSNGGNAVSPGQGEGGNAGGAPATSPWIGSYTGAADTVATSATLLIFLSVVSFIFLELSMM